MEHKTYEDLYLKHRCVSVELQLVLKAIWWFAAKARLLQPVKRQHAT